MADLSVLTDHQEVASLLEQMNLDRATLIDVLRVAASERALCTSNDIRGFDLITMNAKVARGLRDALCGEKWKKYEEDNQEGICHPSLKISIIPCNFDENAGNRLRQPTNIVRKGTASGKKTSCNGTGWLPGLPEIPAQENNEYTTWLFGSHVDQYGALRGELSLPLVFSGKHFSRFNPRIILLDGSEDTSSLKSQTPPDRKDPVEVVDIEIRRK